MPETERSPAAARPDHASRSPEELARLFEHWGRVEAPQLDAPLYEALACAVARDPGLLAIAARARPGQPPPNQLFAAVHYLILRGAEHPLRRHYPSVAAGEREAGAAPDAASAVGDFRDFCLAHRAEIEALVASRLTQTNVIQRSAVLLPAFAHVFALGEGRPLAQLEIGCSAGLNLQWDRFRYAYREPGAPRPFLEWGDPGSAVSIPCERRGGLPLPPLPAAIPVAWRAGIDLNPVDLEDDDAVDWLRALVWPEHVGRFERLAAALALARRHPPQVRAADAAAVLPEVLAEAPPEATLCVFGTHTLYQFPPEGIRAVFRALRQASAARPVFFAGCEGTGEAWSELRVAAHRRGEKAVDLVARCNPHGRWLEWLASRP